MFKMIDSFIGIFVLILILKLAMPKEIGDLISEIFVKVLTFANDSLTQVKQ